MGCKRSSIFLRSQKDDEGWNTPFEFAAWVNQDAMQVAAEVLGVYLAAGVDYSFAIRTLRVPQSDIWYPTRGELVSVGVLSPETLANPIQGCARYFHQANRGSFATEQSLLMKHHR